MKYDIFKNEKEKADARKALPELVKHPGWKFITRALDININYFNEQLREKKDFISLDEVYFLQDRIEDLTSYKNLPANILSENQDDPEDQDDSVYDD